MILLIERFLAKLLTTDRAQRKRVLRYRGYIHSLSLSLSLSLLLFLSLSLSLSLCPLFHPLSILTIHPTLAN